MANEMVVVEKVTRGHSKSSFKVISKFKGDLNKNFDQVCVWYHWKGYLYGPWESDNGHWDAGNGGIEHQRLLKVTNQGHLKRYIDLTVKCDQSVFNYLYRGMGNGWWSVSSSIICPQRLFSGVQIQLKVSLAKSQIQLALAIFYYLFVREIH